MTPEFRKLLSLEQSQKITIGIKRDHANNFWYRTTTIGKIANGMTYVFVLTIIFVFIKLGPLLGVISIMFLGIYIKILNYISGLYTRERLFENEKLFNVAYETGSCTIRINNNNHIMRFPADWKEIIKK